MTGVSKILLGMTAALVLIPTARAEDLAPATKFQFTENAFGCISKEKFDAAYEHAQAGEKGKMEQFFNGYECMPTPTTGEYKVLRVVGDDVEFVNANNQDRQGMWTNQRFIKR